MGDLIGRFMRVKSHPAIIAQPDQEPENIRRPAGLRKHFPVAIGDCMKPVVVQKFQKIMIGKCKKGRFQELPVSSIMGEEIPYPAIMGDIALPGTAYQKLCARGIHLLQKENAVTGSGSMECTEKSCRPCTYDGKIKLHTKDGLPINTTAFFLKYGIHGPFNMLGLGYALFSSPNTNAIMSSVDKQHVGAASGMVATMRSIGQMLSMAIVMLCFSVFLGDSAISAANHPQFIASVRTAFLVFTLLCTIGIFASYTRGTIR
jgi:hypothetical protein